MARPSRWGNPFRIGDTVSAGLVDNTTDRSAVQIPDAATAVAFYRRWARARPAVQQQIREDLAGRDLACWCSADQPCHADVLLEIASTPAGQAWESSETLGGWGLVPVPIVEAVNALNREILRNAHHIDGLVWPKTPRDVQGVLRMSVSDAHKVARASTDLRALLTAYAHRVHQPRPVMSDLARAQEATPQGVPRRYRPSTVAALTALLSEEPDIAAILAGLPSLSLEDLTEFNGAVGRAANAMRVERGEQWCDLPPHQQHPR